MGDRGPKKTPTQALRLTGSRKLKGRKHEPVPPAGDAEAPEWLSKTALRAWKYYAPLLAKMRLLTSADWLALARYCENYSRWLQCKEWLDEHGLTYPLMNKKGGIAAVYPWPEVAMMQNAERALAKGEAEFGLTAAARAGLQVAPPSTKSKEDKFFGVA